MSTAHVMGGQERFNNSSPCRIPLGKAKAGWIQPNSYAPQTFPSLRKYYKGGSTELRTEWKKRERLAAT